MAGGLEEKTVGLTAYFMPVPSATWSAMVLIVVGFVFGILLGMAKGAYEPFRLLEFAGEGIFIVAIPAFLSAISCVAAKRELKFRRMLLLSLVCAVVYAIFYLASTALVGIYAQSIDFVLIGYGLCFIIWYAIAKLVFRLKYSALLFALLQLTYNAIFFYASRIMDIGSGDVLAATLKIYLVSFVFLIALYAIFWLINAPLKRNFGINGIDALSLFLAQWVSSSSDIEGMFESVGQEVETTLGVISFKGRKNSTVFVVPNVHFGPLGNVGGSDFPRLISSMLSAKYGVNAFVFHGTATHDFDPVSSREVENVWKACDDALEGIKYSEARGGFAVGTVGSSRAHCIRVNDAAFVGLSRAPRTTEDVDFGVGMAIGERIMGMGMKHAVVCDAHNAETGEITRVDVGSPISFEYLDAARQAAEAAAAGAGSPIRMGSAQDSFEGFGSAGIGDNGLKCAAFEFGEGGKRKKYLIMLFDSNGITPSFRRTLLDAVQARTGFECEVYTTDTHSVNVVRGVLNPLGRARGGEVIERAAACSKRAVAVVEPVKAGAAVERFGIKVIGTKQTSEFVGTVNAIIAIAKVAVPVLLLATVLFVLWAATKI